jgi:hypothetical protein
MKTRVSWSDPTDDLIAAAHRAGIRMEEIAETLGITLDSVARRRRRSLRPVWEYAARNAATPQSVHAETEAMRDKWL